MPGVVRHAQTSRHGTPRKAYSLCIAGPDAACDAHVAAATTWQWHADGLRVAWDGLRRDADIWDDDGDCLVYLYAQGTSRRQPSFQVSLQRLAESRCDALLDAVVPPPPSAGPSAKSELYIGAPAGSDRVATLAFHVATRNVFAWLLHKPLVGAHLGPALGALLDRLNAYRPDSARDNLSEVLAFAASMGYSAVGHRPDYAAAMLVFAGQQRLRELWVSAFAHCVGMSDTIDSAPDYALLSNVDRAALTKAALRLDIDLEAKCRSMATLLEDDFGPSRLGLAPAARTHLDSFRTFLATHLVSVFGYWPPTENLSRDRYLDLKAEFENLFYFLADLRSANSLVRRTATSGGLCTHQNLSAFDTRHALPPLDTRLPLLPTFPVATKASRRRSVFSFMSLQKVADATTAAMQAELITASNNMDPAAAASPLVHAFMDFERAQVDAAQSQQAFEDGRKVRWMLVYGLLQILKSIVGAPANTDTNVSYPLCCDMSSVLLPAWHRSPARLTKSQPLTSSLPNIAAKRLQAQAGQRPGSSGASSALSVHPDGETDYATYSAATAAAAPPPPRFSRKLSTRSTASTRGPAAVENDADVHPALRRALPLRSHSSTSAYTRSKSRLVTAPVIMPELVLAHPALRARAHQSSASTDSNTSASSAATASTAATDPASVILTPLSDVPSFGWSSDDADTTGSPSDYSHSRSASDQSDGSASSLYSDESMPATPMHETASAGKKQVKFADAYDSASLGAPTAHWAAADPAAWALTGAAWPAPLRVPSLPPKHRGRGDVLDKGLAQFDETMLPGLC